MSDTVHTALVKDGLWSQGSPPEALLFPPAIIFVLCSSLFIALFGCILQLRLLALRRVPAFPGEGQGTVPSPWEQHSLIGMFGARGGHPRAPCWLLVLSITPWHMHSAPCVRSGWRSGDGTEHNSRSFLFEGRESRLKYLFFFFFKYVTQKRRS